MTETNDTAGAVEPPWWSPAKGRARARQPLSRGAIVDAAIKVLDENPYSGFPKKSEVWGNRRYWPAVELWFQKHQDLDTGPDPGKPRLR